MNSRAYVLQLLTSPGTKLLSTKEEYLTALLDYFPVNATPQSSWGEDPKTYKEYTADEFRQIKAQSAIPVTTDFASNEIEPGSLGYHRIKGLITSDSYWYFSSKQFELDLLLAESNPNITCHFLHITSGGGEAWYLDRLAETLHTLSKPVYTLIERVCASAGYYIGCNGNVVKALTQNDIIGCIGTMVAFWDMEPYFESLGFKKIEEYAHASGLKNKKYNDLKGGKPAQYITEELDPLCEQFLAEVRNARAVLAVLPDDAPVLQGETFDGTNAVEVGLIDGICTFSEALAEAHALGAIWADKHCQRNRALSFI